MVTNSNKLPLQYCDRCYWSCAQTRGAGVLMPKISSKASR